MIRRTQLLVVDSRPCTARRFRRILGQDEYEILEAADCESALRMAGEHAFDLVLIHAGLAGNAEFCPHFKSGSTFADSILALIMEEAHGLSARDLPVLSAGMEVFIEPFRDAEVAGRIRSLVNLRSLRLALRASEQNTLAAGASYDLPSYVTLDATLSTLGLQMLEGRETTIRVIGRNLTGTTGPHAPAPTNAVVVTNPDTQSASCTCSYSYDASAAPSVSSISPASGPTTGGTAVTISGANFQSGATATVGGVALTAVSVTSTTLTGKTGTHAAGVVSVVVTNPDTQAGSCACTYEYLIVPVISNVRTSPNPTTASVTWTTDIPADSQVEYGTTTAYGSKSALNSSLVTSHSVKLSGLTRLTTYHYRVLSRASSGGLAVSGDFTFTTK